MPPLDNAAIAEIDSKRKEYFPAISDLKTQNDAHQKAHYRHLQCSDDSRRIFHPTQIAIDRIQRDIQYRMPVKEVSNTIILQTIQNASQIRRSMILFVLYYAEHFYYDSHCIDEDRIAYEYGMELLQKSVESLL